MSALCGHPETDSFSPVNGTFSIPTNQDGALDGGNAQQSVRVPPRPGGGGGDAAAAAAAAQDLSRRRGRGGVGGKPPLRRSPLIVVALFGRGRV